MPEVPGYSPEKEELKPGKMIVEIGPANNSVVKALNQEGEFLYGNEVMFDLKKGDTLIGVDLPVYRSMSAFMHTGLEPELNHLKDVKDEMERRLPEGVRSEAVYADAQRLPLRDEETDIVYMSNVLSSQIKDEQFFYEPGSKQGRREKLNLIGEAKRILKRGGRLIIFDEMPPAPSVKMICAKLISEIKNDPDFDLQTFQDDTVNDDDEMLVLELTKK